MQLGMDGDVSYRARCLQNWTGDEFCTLREIKKCLHPEAHVIFSLTHAQQLRVFKYLKRAKRANFRFDLKNIASKRRDV